MQYKSVDLGPFVHHLITVLRFYFTEWRPKKTIKSLNVIYIWNKLVPGQIFLVADDSGKCYMCENVNKPTCWSGLVKHVKNSPRGEVFFLLKQVEDMYQLYHKDHVQPRLRFHNSAKSSLDSPWATPPNMLIWANLAFFSDPPSKVPGKFSLWWIFFLRRYV